MISLWRLFMLRPRRRCALDPGQGTRRW